MECFLPTSNTGSIYAKPVLLASILHPRLSFYGDAISHGTCLWSEI